MKFTEFIAKKTVYQIRLKDHNNKPLPQPQVDRIFILAIHEPDKHVLASINGMPARYYGVNKYNAWVTEKPTDIKPSIKKHR